MGITMTPREQFHSNEPESFEAALANALAMRSADPSAGTVPGGLEQRLLARLAQAAEQPEASRIPASSSRPGFTFVEIGKSKRSASSIFSALGLHGLVIALIAFVVAAQVHRPLVKTAHEEMAVDLTPPPPPPVAPRLDKQGGGGGHHDITAATAGRLPEFSRQQFVPPMQPPRIEARLPVDPTLVMQPDLKMANTSMVNFGDPNSNLKGVSLGTGSGTGVGTGNGPGFGSGTGGGAGGGVFHIGGSIHKPELLVSPEPEFSEEARKAKFSGNVEVYLWVDEQGNPSHVKVVRPIGMGLDEKALEAVRRYKFKPATQNGKPVKVDLYVDVNFTIL